MTKTRKDNRRSSRVAFSLIELIIVLVLITTVATLVATKLYQSGANKQLEASVKAIHNHLELAKKLAQVTNNEMRVVIEKQNGTYFLAMEGEGLSEKMKKKFAIKRPLPGIRDVTLSNPSVTTKPNVTQISMISYGPLQTELVLYVVGSHKEIETALDDFTDRIEGSDEDTKALRPQSSS